MPHLSKSNWHCTWLPKWKVSIQFVTYHASACCFVHFGCKFPKYSLTIQKVMKHLSHFHDASSICRNFNWLSTISNRAKIHLHCKFHVGLVHFQHAFVWNSCKFLHQFALKLHACCPAQHCNSLHLCSSWWQLNAKTFEAYACCCSMSTVCFAAIASTIDHTCDSLQLPQLQMSQDKCTMQQ